MQETSEFVKFLTFCLFVVILLIFLFGLALVVRWIACRLVDVWWDKRKKEPLNMASRQVCEAAIEKWGLDNQLLQLQEEAAELIVAISHFRRGRLGSRDEVVEELADMEIMLEQMRSVFGDADIDNMSIKKADRLCDKLDMECSRRPGRRSPPPRPRDVIVPPKNRPFIVRGDE